MTDQSVTILSTDRLVLRLFQDSDIDAFAAIEADPEVMRYFTSGTRTREQAARGIARFIQLQLTHGHSLWAVEKAGVPGCIGYCGLVPQTIGGRREYEIGYKLAQKYWSQGLATEAATAVREWGFNNLRANRLISIVDPSNIASIRVAEKIGMRYVQDAEYDGKKCRIYAVNRPLA